MRQVVCGCCRVFKVRLTSGVLVCVSCDFGPTGMKNLPVADRVKGLPQ